MLRHSADVLREHGALHDEAPELGQEAERRPAEEEEGEKGDECDDVEGRDGRGVEVHELLQSGTTVTPSRPKYQYKNEAIQPRF